MVNRVGLGTWPLTTVSQGLAGYLIRQFINGGGYYIDTAPLYGFGQIENLLGKILKKFDRSRFYITSKCGYVDVEGKSMRTVKKGSKYSQVIAECDNSLRRLGLDYLDLYFVHYPDPHTPFAETMKALIKLQSGGKIKKIGVSNVSLDQLREYNQTGQVKFVQNRFSLVSRIDEDYQKYLLEHDIGLVPYHVVERGLLTNKVLAGVEKLRHGDLGVARADWDLTATSDWVKNQVTGMARKAGITLGQLAISWALHQAYVSWVLVGVTQKLYLADNLQANYIKLSPDILQELGLDKQPA